MALTIWEIGLPNIDYYATEQALQDNAVDFAWAVRELITWLDTVSRHEALYRSSETYFNAVRTSGSEVNERKKRRLAEYGQLAPHEM